MNIGSVGSAPPEVSVAVEKKALENQEQIAKKLLESVEASAPAKGNSSKVNVVA